MPGSSVHEILQERILEWVTISFSRASSRPRGRTRVSCIAGRLFTIWETRETHFFTFLSLTSLIKTILCLTLEFQLKFMASIDTRTDWLWYLPQLIFFFNTHYHEFCALINLFLGWCLFSGNNSQGAYILIFYTLGNWKCHSFVFIQDCKLVQKTNSRVKIVSL